VNDSTATPVDLTPIAEPTWDDGTNTATWNFTPAVIDVGFHTVTLVASGITDAAGNPLDGGDDFVVTEVAGLPLLVAVPGDTNLDGEFNTDDISNILGALSFENPPAPVGGVPPGPVGPWSWAEGDATGDGYVDTDDISEMLATLMFEAGPYAATSSPATDSSAEPIAVSSSPTEQLASSTEVVSRSNRRVQRHSSSRVNYVESAQPVSRKLRRLSARAVDQALAGRRDDRHEHDHLVISRDAKTLNPAWDDALLAIIDGGQDQ
jgi:hypothetical protein